MYPWLWLWAPRFELPLSGNVSQDIEPIANLFSGVTDPEAGDPAIEQRAFRLASYGKQLGLITEVLIAVAESSLPKNGSSNRALQELKRIQQDIQTIKDEEHASELQSVGRRIKAIQRRGGPQAEALGKLLSVPGPSSGT